MKHTTQILNEPSISPSMPAIKVHTSRAAWVPGVVPAAAVCCVCSIFLFGGVKNHRHTYIHTYGKRRVRRCCTELQLEKEDTRNRENDALQKEVGESGARASLLALRMYV